MTDRSWLNLPNVITFTRILAAPIFFAVLIASNATSPMRWLVVLMFVAAIATDGVDGSLARKRNQVTNLGKLLDPIADKVLIGAALIGLVMVGRIGTLAAGLILVREIGITVYRMLVLKRRVVAANAGGKIKTILQSVTVGLLLSPLDLYLPFLQPIESFLVFITVVLTVWTGATYLRDDFRNSGV